jgi:hypothetical protein
MWLAAAGNRFSPRSRSATLKQDDNTWQPANAMFRTASWLVYGAKWYKASGFERSAQRFDARDDQVRSVSDDRRSLFMPV